jgi:hypothetical protein
MARKNNTKDNNKSKKSQNGFRFQGRNPKSNKKKGNNNQNRRSDTPDTTRLPDNDQVNDTKISPYSNDPAWWENNNGLTAAATNIGTRTPIGYLLDYGLLGEFTPTGILRLDYAPCFGTIGDVTDGVNVAAKNLYNKINAQNSRSASYDPNDLAIYIIAVANAWVLHSWLRRLIGTINSYSAQNRYWFDPLLETMHVAPIDETNDITRWINLADWIALQLDRLPVPEDIAYFIREQRLCEAFYADNLVEKAGIVYLNPISLLKFQYDAEGKGMLKWFDTPWKNSVGRDVTPAAVREYFKNLTINLFNDSDTVLMQSDIRRAFSTLYTLGKMDPDFTLGLQYDANLNLQIKNATEHKYLLGATYEITQDMDRNVLRSNDLGQWVLDHMTNLKTDPSTIAFNDFSTMIFDFPTDSVTSQSWTEATKLHSFWIGHSDLVATTEIVLKVATYTFVPSPSGSGAILQLNQNLMYLGIVNGSTLTAAGVSGWCDKIQAVQKFATAPLQFAAIVKPTLVDSTWTYNKLNIEKTYIFNDLNNFVPVPRINLTTIRDYAQLSILTQGKFGDNHLGVGKL